MDDGSAALVGCGSNQMVGACRTEGKEDQTYCCHSPILLSLLRNTFQPILRAVQSRLMAVNTTIHFIEKSDLSLQLVSHLHRQLPLPANTLAKCIKLVILLLEDLLVVSMDLLVVKPLCWIRRLRLIRVPLGEQGSPIRVIVVVQRFLRWVVSEADILGGSGSIFASHAGRPLRFAGLF
jgi:hypothetical protein